MRVTEPFASTVAAVIGGVIRQLVDYPDRVAVEVVCDQEEMILKVRVSSSDVQRVLGENGRTLRSLKSLIAALGHRKFEEFTRDVPIDIVH